MMAKFHSSFAKAHLEKITTYQTGVVQAAVNRLLNREMAKFLQPYGITCTQWFIIGLILDAGHEGLRLTDLMRKLDTTLPFITTHLNLLESRNIVLKRMHPTDNRTKIVTITDKFRPTCKEIEADLRENLRELLYKNITREELQVYVNVLHKMTAVSQASKS